ncbi:hypothetical protein M942_19910 [Enterobacter ludwigii]|jgi:hypothetical protein|uniref:hypothetical protein n=1 Tax=Enterobacter ludwigii TaxID=299767 RepID=UPI0003D86F5B|nr:hypothetical protein [Enterobacter ludwigii]AHE73313.1 hypothetical protein M942_19910 [Enterobacter ludwigii]
MAVLLISILAESGIPTEELPTSMVALSGSLFFIVIVILVSATTIFLLSYITPVMSITSSGFLTGLPDKVQHLTGS